MTPHEMMSPRPASEGRITRRAVLRYGIASAGMLGTAALLQACGTSTPPAPSTTAPTANAPAASSPQSAPSAAAAASPAAAARAASPAAQAPAGVPTAAPLSFDQVLAGAKKEGHVHLWSNVPTKHTTLAMLQDAFDKKFGGGISIDQTPLAAGAAASRLIAEAQAGRHDGDLAQPSPDIAYNLLKAGLGVKRDWQATFGAQLPKLQSAVDSVAVPQLRGVGLSYWDVVYVLLYNSTMVNESQLPKTWDDLGTSQFGSQLAIDVRGYPFNFLVLHPDWGQARTEKLVRAINAQKPLKQQGAPQVSDAVGRGEAPMGIGSVSDIALQQKNGRPIKGLVFAYVPLNPLMAFVPSQPGDPNAAQLFAAWLASEGVGIIESQEFNGRLSDPASQTHKLVYSQQPNPKLAQVRSLADMQTSAAFLKLAGNIFTGAA